MSEFYTEVWFWLIVIGVILVIIGIILYVAQQTIEWYHWILWIVGGFFLLIGIIWAIGYSNRDETPPGYVKVDGTQHYVDAAGNNVFVDGRALKDDSVPLPNVNNGCSVIATGVSDAPTSSITCGQRAPSSFNCKGRYCPPRRQNKCQKDARNSAMRVSKGQQVVAVPPINMPISTVNPVSPTSVPIITVPAVTTAVAQPTQSAFSRPSVSFSQSSNPGVPMVVNSPLVQQAITPIPEGTIPKGRTVTRVIAPPSSGMFSQDTKGIDSRTIANVAAATPVLRLGATATQYAPGVPIPGLQTAQQSTGLGTSALGAAPVNSSIFT